VSATSTRTLTRFCRVLGHDHLHSMISANNLAADLRALGESKRARDLDEQTLGHFRQMLGDDHPDTLAAASYLAADLHALGQHQEASQLQQWIDSRSWS
jgi:hypothetical protein